MKRYKAIEGNGEGIWSGIVLSRTESMAGVKAITLGSYQIQIQSPVIS